MKNYSQLFLFLIAYFLFFDGVNTIASIAVSFGTDEFRLSQAASGLFRNCSKSNCSPNDDNFWQNC